MSLCVDLHSKCARKEKLRENGSTIVIITLQTNSDAFTMAEFLLLRRRECFIHHGNPRMSPWSMKDIHFLSKFRDGSILFPQLIIYSTLSLTHTFPFSKNLPPQKQNKLWLMAELLFDCFFKHWNQHHWWKILGEMSFFFLLLFINNKSLEAFLT